AVALVTGAASGIGFEAAAQFAERGLRVGLVDLAEQRLEAARANIHKRAPAAEIEVIAVDVSDRNSLLRLKGLLTKRFGGVDVLMNNAAIGAATDAFGSAEAWERTLAVNLWGVIHGSQIFAPDMVARGRPGLIINTGSKQGITTPPGNPAYNVAKAGVK